MERARCLVVVPYRDAILPGCEDALRGLEALGYPVRRDGGPEPIDEKRSRLASEALAAGHDEVFWVDSDMGFQPEDVDRIRAHGFPMVGGLYSRRGQRELAFRPLRGTPQLVLGDGAPAMEVQYVATGFLLTHRSVYDAVARAFALPLCNASSGAPWVPYYMPMILDDPEFGYGYLSEDYSFSERARRAGHKVMLDPSIRLWHIGGYGYGWEDLRPIARLPGANVQLGRR